MSLTCLMSQLEYAFLLESPVENRASFVALLTDRHRQVCGSCSCGRQTVHERVKLKCLKYKCIAWINYLVAQIISKKYLMRFAVINASVFEHERSKGKFLKQKLFQNYFFSFEINKLIFICHFFIYMFMYLDVIIASSGW